VGLNECTSFGFRTKKFSMFLLYSIVCFGFLEA
jgi:hypothetical protein